MRQSFKSKKWTSCVLTAAMAVTVLSACSGNNSNGGNNTATNKPAQSQAPEQNEAPPALTSLTYYTRLSNEAGATMSNLSEHKSLQELEKRTGVKVKYEHPPAGEGQDLQSLNLMIASGKYTDIIDFNWLNGFPGGPEKALNDGVLIELNDLIEEHAPNLSKILKENPDIKKQISTDSGKIYAFPNLSTDPRGLTFVGPVIRQDWLDKLGLSTPTTVDEWYQVLKAFKEKDPNGNGKPDEIPFHPDNGWWLKESSFLLGAWGVGYNWYHEDGKVKYGALEPGFKEYVTTLNKWYKEGLMDKEFATTDLQLFDAKMTGDRMGSSILLAGGGVGKYNQLMAEKNKNYKLVGTPLPVLNKGDKPLFGQKDNNYAGMGTGITTANKNPIETVKYLDYRYSDEGRLLLIFGIEGESYDMINGYPTYNEQITKNPDGLPMSHALAQYSVGLPTLTDIRFNEQYSWKTQELKDSIANWSAPTNERRMPPVTPSPEESQKLSSIMNDVTTYRDEMVIKFVMGAEPLDNYDRFVEQLKSMGIEEAVGIYQKALDRYNAR
ncbi:ABC transporter substrate-binding protein [Paenibacillus sp. GCM10023252]|uniref:ABC transporter substrate-binding protein n=1 Tax=Paenibacillus sp. GCM10023252 TaxID=3252649 RepID=UPI00360DB594